MSDQASELEGSHVKNASPIYTDDAFLGGKIVVRQPLRGYRAGVDAVLLAAAASSQEFRGKALDAGAGAGAVGLCLAARCPGATVTLVERQPDLAELARCNIKANSLETRVRVVELDIVRAPSAFSPEILQPNSFDLVLANPPYHDEGAGTLSRDASKAASNAMPAEELDAWVRFLARMAAPGARALMIHKADALPRVLAGFDGRFGGLRILPIHPRPHQPAHRVIVCGVKGSRAPLTVMPSFILHADGEGFTSEANAIFRHGAALDLVD